ncbi:MAG TPA: YfiR family protein, partial [Candidatus Binatia bacterium]
PTSFLPRTRGRTTEGRAIASCSFFRLLYYTALCAVLLSVVYFTAPARGQVSREYQLKAVFLFRLAQFTQWPGDAFENPTSPIVICVLGENPFGDALDAAVRGETAHERKLVARYHRAVDQIKGCHMLFTSAAGLRQSKEIMAALAGRSVLTVADDGSASEAMVRFMTEQNKIKLLVNPKAAAAGRLVFDPRLLRAAEIVGD